MKDATRLGLALFLVAVAAGAWFYLAKTNINITPVSGGQATGPLALARIEMRVPVSWRVVSYRTDLIFDKKATQVKSSRQATLNEMDLDGSYDSNGSFNPNLFPEFQSRSLSYEEAAQLAAPEGLGRPFKGLALVNKFTQGLMYVAAMEINGFLLHLTIGLERPAGRDLASPEDHNKLFAEQMDEIFQIYTAEPELREPSDLRTRFGRVRQNPEHYFVKQTINLASPEDDFNFGAAIWVKGDCGHGEQYQLCAGLNQFFEPDQEPGSSSDHLVSLISGYSLKVLETGEKQINGLEAHVSAALRLNILPWGFDGEWDSLITSLRLYAGPEANRTAEVLMAASSENMWGRGRLEERFSRHYGTIKDIWASARPL